MQEIIESIFDSCYLITVITTGIIMIVKSRQLKQYKLFGLMALVLGFGDSFHLIPRIIALCTTGISNYTVPLGIGKFITSITMTIFYVLLYTVWVMRYQKQQNRQLTLIIYTLAIIRILLCLMPQNSWTVQNPPLLWGIYRNIPFALMGIIIIILFYQKAAKNKEDTSKHMWLAITLSFAFYIPVVLFASTLPIIGALMIPKTCAYVWAIFIGYKSMKKEIISS